MGSDFSNSDLFTPPKENKIIPPLKKIHQPLPPPPKCISQEYFTAELIHCTEDLNIPCYHVTTGSL
jgi:hypothetical protein